MVIRVRIEAKKGRGEAKGGDLEKKRGGGRERGREKGIERRKINQGERE